MEGGRKEKQGRNERRQQRVRKRTKNEGRECP